MNLNKYFTIVIIIFCLLLLSDGIYASEIENTTTQEEPTNINEEYIEHTTITSTTELKNVFETVEESTSKNHEINLTPQTYHFTKPIKCDFYSPIEKNIILNGNNAIIDTGNRAFLSITENINITINNLTIMNTRGIYGTAITNAGKLTANNITFENNYVDIGPELAPGGVVYSSNSINLTNCVFKNNHGKENANTILINTKNNTIPEVNIINCQFINNTSDRYGTIHLLDYIPTKIINCTFINDKSNNSIILNPKSYLSIENCIFTNESSPNIIMNGNICEINNTKFTNTLAENIIQNNNKLTLDNSEILENTANTIITNNYILKIEDSVISNNTINETLLLNNIPENEVECDLNISNTTFSNNIANWTSGIENRYEYRTTRINNSSFINNTSLLNYGIIFDQNGKMCITNSKFYNNTAEDLFKGDKKYYPLVRDNEYKGNLLKIYLNYSAFSDDNKVKISGLLETDEIYNTSVNSGLLSLNNKNDLIEELIIHEENFNIFTGELDDLYMKYDGLKDFRNISKEILISVLTEDYDIEISNISKTFCYGDYISFELNIKNSGSVSIQDMKLIDVLPNELIYYNSTDEFNHQTNEYFLNILNVNETKNVIFYVTPYKYDDLSISFNIGDNKSNKTYTCNEEIIFIKPRIELNKIIAHPGEIINISARVSNYNKNSISDVNLIFNYKNADNYSYSFNDNLLLIENYKLDEKLTKKDYNIRLNCDDELLNYSFTNSSIVSIIKFETHSITDYDISNGYLDLNISIFDESDNLVDAGSVIIKVNGKTIKTLKVTNGSIHLENYKLTPNYDNEYALSIMFTGNNKYNLHENSFNIKEMKKNISILLNYDIIDNNIIITVNISTEDNVLPESGYVAIKINDKTISNLLNINESYCLTYDLSEINSLNNIGVFYYGNELYSEKIHKISL